MNRATRVHAGRRWVFERHPGPDAIAEREAVATGQSQGWYDAAGDELAMFVCAGRVLADVGHEYAADVVLDPSEVLLALEAAEAETASDRFRVPCLLHFQHVAY